MWDLKSKSVPVVVEVMGLIKKGSQEEKKTSWRTIFPGNLQNTCNKHNTYLAKRFVDLSFLFINSFLLFN